MSGFEHAAARLIDLLRQRGWRLVTAESCTGGLIAAAITSVAGSSDVFDRGLVTYSNRAKVAELGVDAAVIAEHGAVSADVAARMALGALEVSGVEVSISVTGIAGPGGGNVEKPVGLVFMAVAITGKEPAVERHVFVDQGREGVRQAAVDAALALAIATLQ